MIMKYLHHTRFNTFNLYEHDNNVHDDYTLQYDAELEIQNKDESYK